MTFAIRAAASAALGTGHITRCLTLANALKALGGRCVFICDDLPASLEKKISVDGHSVRRVSRPDAETTITALEDVEACAMVVDDYGLDANWEEAIRSRLGRLAVIDDLGREHACDLLLDQNYFPDMDRRYEGRLPAACVQLIGPRYALLRPEFYDARCRLTHRGGPLRTVLVMFGGTDPTRETSKALDAIALLDAPDLRVTVATTGANPNVPALRNQVAADPRAKLLVDSTDIAGCMLGADLLVGAGGSTNWERCFLGLPAITISVAAHQVPINEALEAAGTCRYLGDQAVVSAAWIASSVEQLLARPADLNRMSERGLALMGPPPDDGIPPFAKAVAEMGR